MFVEGNVEIKIKDRSTIGFDEHELKIWVQSSFKTLACYRVSNFAKDSDKLVKATVAIRTDHLDPDERQALEENPQNYGALRSHIERTFSGKGVCRAVGEPKLKRS
jgi:hypothetical protein